MPVRGDDGVWQDGGLLLRVCHGEGLNPALNSSWVITI
jgi:uncharacterized protein YukJ